MTEIDPQRQLGTLVRDNPAFARVFEDLNIDYCCGGDQTLEAACDVQGLDVDEVSQRLQESRRQPEDDVDWETMTDLIEHVVDTHHEYLSDELPALAALVEKVRDVHGDNHPELHDLEDVFDALAEEMREHTTEEEEEVFPVIEKVDRGESLSEAEAARLREALDDLEDDHEATAEHLERIAELTDGYAVPEDACPSYKGMLDRLEDLERDTHRHVHKENNVLFPTVESHLAEG